jgi:hypothetical protein
MSQRPRYEYDHVKPLPSQERDDVPPPPFEDEPLVSQRIPEAPAFVNAYNAVGRPRLTVLVTRTLKGLDSEAIENTLADWFSCNGRVTMLSPTVAHQKLGDEQIKGVQSGSTKSLGEVADQTGVDVVIRVDAQTTDQYDNAERIRLVCEAMNTRDGESIGHAVVDMPVPLQKPQINSYTRYLARKLMDDMTNAWVAPVPAGEPAPPASSRSVPPTMNDLNTRPAPAHITTPATKP